MNKHQYHESKLDFTKGFAVKEYLESLGLETPTVEAKYKTNEEKIAALTEAYAKIHAEVFGLDLNDDSLMDTPRRIAKLQVFESMKGLDYANFPKITVVENKFYDGFVSVNNIQVLSLCEHHHERIIGKAWVAYIPGKEVPGLSKIPRIIDFFASRPTVQERLTSQVFETLKFLLKTDDVAVTIKAVHMCMRARGIKDPCSDTTTALKGGLFMTDAALRTEYESQVNHAANPLL